MSQWLNAEALAQYVVGALTAAITILGWRLFRRERARYILVEPVLELSLMWIHSAFRDRITVTLHKGMRGEEQIDKLSQLRVRISNTTRETINNVVLRFFFKPPIPRILDHKLDPPREMLGRDDPPHCQLESESQTLVVSLPYLKSSDVYGEKQNATLTLLADGAPRIDDVIGGGPDWAAQYLSGEDRFKQEARQFGFRLIMIMIAAFTIFITTMWALYPYLSRVLSFSLRDLISGVIIGFIFAGIVGNFYIKILQRWKRVTAIQRVV